MNMRSYAVAGAATTPRSAWQSPPTTSLAAGALAEQAAPVSGTYGGNATSKVETWVSIGEVRSLV